MQEKCLKWLRMVKLKESKIFDRLKTIKQYLIAIFSPYYLEENSVIK